ncbi:MAG: crosslink repair DNA glycosylase YcaQ family protein, partial [Anaeromyxobacteraceae bacterium]
MARPPALTAAQARLLHLAAQGLLAPPPRAARRADVLAAVRRMELLQLDTIQVVARSHHLVLHARLGDHPLAWLDELLAEGALFETWAHEACLAPAEDHGLHRRLLATSQHWGVRRARRVLAEEREAMTALLEEVRRRGPVKASDFQGARPHHGGWWGWKKEKSWLEAWLALGELMVARRERFQRVYDLSERVLPPAARRPPPDDASARRAAIERSVRALGVTQARWVNDYFRIRPRVAPEELRPLVQAGTLLEVRVRGWPAPGFVHHDHAPLLRAAVAGKLRATHTALLSPFDPVVWDRERALALFGFDYRLECYVPARKRRHGYYVLPILRRGAIVGRLDAKAHRDRGVFEVKALHLEPGVKPGPALLRDLAAALLASARWHGTPEVRLGRRVPPELRALLGPRLA